MTFENQLNLAQARVLITGASGMLGNSFVNQLKLGYPDCRIIATDHASLDVTQRDDVLNLARLEKPDLIIHCAAEVIADRCQRDPQHSKSTIVDATQNVLDAAQLNQSKLIYPQSFLIYGESETEVNEDTSPNPLSTYATHKLMAEKLIKEQSHHHLVIRMAGFFGGEKRDKNFVGIFTRKIAELLRDGISTYAVGGRVWQPTYTEDLAKNSLLLAESNATGTWCMASNGYATFHDVATEIINLLSLAERIAIPRAIDQQINSMDVAPRPKQVIMSTKKLLDSGLNIQRDWRTSLSEYLKQPWFQSLFR
jgi:dTDP-4-dehydrorhamnose reductase